VVDEETGEEVVEEAPTEVIEVTAVCIDDAPPVQTEMFVKSELDDATAVLSHLLAERKKRIKAVNIAESNLDKIEQRVEEQKRVIARIQSQMPAATTTPEADPAEPEPAEEESEEVPDEDVEIDMDESDEDWMDDEDEEDGEEA
jgi:hypothetical protein